MASKKISDLNVSVQLDTDQAQKDARNLDKDIKSLNKQVANADRTTERYENQLAELSRQYKQGEISSRQFGQMQDKIAARQMKATKSLDRQTAALKKFRAEQTKLGKLKSFVTGGMSGKMTAGLAGGAALGFAAQQMASNLQEQFSEAMRNSGTAEMLGMLPKELASMKFALSQLTGIDGDSVADSLLDVKERLGEIADDAGGALGKAGKAINLQADKLIGKGMAAQLEGITTALSNITDEETRLFRARELFGDEAARMLTSAVRDQKKLNELQKQASKLNLTMNEQQLAAAKEANLEFAKAAVEIKSAGRDIAIAIAPLLSRSAKQIAASARYFNRDDGSYSIDAAPEWMQRLWAAGSDAGRTYTGLRSQMRFGVEDTSRRGSEYAQDRQNRLNNEVSEARARTVSQLVTDFMRVMDPSTGPKTVRDQVKAFRDYLGSTSTMSGVTALVPMPDGYSGEAFRTPSGDMIKASMSEMIQRGIGAFSPEAFKVVKRLEREARQSGQSLNSVYKKFENDNKISTITTRLFGSLTDGMLGAAKTAGAGISSKLSPVLDAVLGIDTIGLAGDAFGLRKADRQKDADNFKALADSIGRAKKNARLDAISGGQAEMDRFRNFRAEAKANASFGAASSFSAGSVEEFEFRRDKQLQAEKIAEEKRLAKEEREFQAALNQRIIEKLDEIGGADPLAGDDFNGVN